MNDREKFFDRLYSCCDGRIELRIISKRGAVQKVFAEIGDHATITETCERYKSSNIYFGVGTRDTTGAGKKENVINIPALWIDIDFKDVKPSAVKTSLDTFPHKPTAAILTGHGVHFYWILKEPSEREDFDRIENLLRRIACHFNGDFSACEVARVLRVPGTVNVKRDLVPVKMHFLDDFSYSLEDFDYLPSAPIAEKLNGGKNPVNTPGWMSEAFKGIPEGGNDHFPGRDAAACKLAGYFIDRIPSKDVLAVLRGWNTHNIPPLSEGDIQRIFNSVIRYKRAEKNEQFKTYFTGSDS